MKETKNVNKNDRFFYKKSLGQNFLTDEKLLAEIVINAGVNKDTTVLEIGCGAGALTAELAKSAKKVIGYEIDGRLIPTLNKIAEEYGNVEIINKDVMKESLSEIEKRTGKDYLLVANLPYYITTPVIMRFIENSVNIKGMAVMVQEEVADRLAAAPKTSDYGAITVAINLRGEAKKILRVGREKFTPVPNVDSAVVKIDIDKDKFKGEDLFAVRDTVKCGFNNRRKTLLNNIVNYYGIKREIAENIITGCGFSPLVRGEELSAADYVKLTDALKENGYEKDSLSNKK